MTNKCCNDKDDEDVSNSGFKGKNKLTGPNDVNIHFSKFLTTMAIHHATKLRKMDDITTAKANLQGEELAKFEQLMGTLKNFAELLPPLAPGARVVAMENDYHRRKLESHREEEDDSDDEEGGDHDQVRSGAGASSWSPPLISRLQVGPGTTDQSPPVYTEQVISGTPVEQKGGAAFNTLKEAYNAVFKDPTKYEGENSINIFDESVLVWKKLIEFHLKPHQRRASTSSIDDLHVGPRPTKAHRYVRNAEGKLEDSENKDALVTQYTGSGQCRALGLDVEFEQCESLLHCLNHGSPDKVAKCLAALENRDIFEEAKKNVNEEVTAGSKELVVKILTQFGVQGTSVRVDNQDVILPVDKSMWFQSLTHETQEAIQKTPALKEYIESLIDLIHDSPGILNKNYKGTGVRNKDTDYFVALKLEDFVQPGQQSRRSVDSELLARLPQVSSNVFSLFGGFIPTNLKMASSNGMKGGGYDGGKIAPVYGNTIENMISHLEADGFKINRTQLAQLRDGVEKAKVLENKFATVVNVLSSLLEIKHIYGLPDGAGRLAHTVDLEAISTPEGFSNYVVSQINAIRRYLSENQNLQVACANDLNRHIASLYSFQAGNTGTYMPNATSVHPYSRSVSLNETL